MKKKKVLFSLLALAALAISMVSNPKINFNDDIELSKLSIAGAQGEIIIGPLCFATSAICVVWTDGVFLNGTPYEG